MSALGSPDSLLLSSSGGYEIERSLRFNDDDTAYLSRTPSSASNRKTWTWSAWVKLSKIPQSVGLFSTRNGNQQTTIFANSGTFQLYSEDSNAVTRCNIKTSGLYRDPSAWYHIVFAVDAANTDLDIYVNGEEVSQNVITAIQNVDLHINSTLGHTIGREATQSNYFDGYMTEIHFVDGTQLAASNFGETDTETGAWIPKKYGGSYGTNGFYLNFSDNSSVSALGTDTSGRGNNWTVSPNFSVTAGAGNDSVTDSPTNNYPTLNPLDKTGGTMAQGNLTYTGVYSDVVTRNGHGARSTLKVPSSGKWYVEAANITSTGGGNSGMLGFTSSEARVRDVSAFAGNLTPFIGANVNVFSNRITLSWVGVSGGTANGTTLFSSCASGDIVNFAIDFDDGKFWVGKNGTWYNSGDPAAGTNATCTFTAGTKPWGFWAEYVASSDNSNRSQPRVNFGQQGFEYTAPSGFLEMNTANLPEPTIKDGTDYFNTVLYTGNGSTGHQITGVGFQPDFVWLKERSSTSHNQLLDAVRGAGKRLESSTNPAEITPSPVGLSSFDSDGFTVENNNGYNQSSQTYAAWNWKAGGSGSSNTDGSITSTVSANVDAGFSIVSYTGNGTAGATIGHGLGVTPAMMIVKNRDATDEGMIYHKDIYTSNPSNYYLKLFPATTASGQSGRSSTGSPWNDTEPTSSVFSVSSEHVVNASGERYIAYCFAEVEGFSKIAGYTGNGSTDGVFVNLGFKPSWVIIKRTNTSSNWVVYDTVRQSYNVNTLALYPNLNNTEGTVDPSMDFLSNGIKFRNSTSTFNTSGSTYIFMAFAETPFKYANAR